MLYWSQGPKEKLVWLRKRMIGMDGKGWSRLGWVVWRMWNREWIDHQWWKQGYRLDKVYGWSKEDGGR